ncbi:MAG: hypothetical protein GY793_03035 [Proteobacteria bacterium]|nr:hypothetical protein [Pseudomonadota bacterium]
MFILKFFGSVIVLFMFLGLLFAIFGLVIAQTFFKDLSRFFNTDEHGNIKQSPRPKNSSRTTNKRPKQSSKEIPTISECSKCGTYYTEVPEDGKCSSCGAKL